MKRFFFVFYVLLLSIMITACGAEGLFGPTATLTPTNTPSLTATLTPTNTPSPTPSNTPSPTPIPFGGSGLIVVGTGRCKTKDDCTNYVYLHNFSTHQTTLILENYSLLSVAPDDNRLLISQDSNLFVSNLDGSEMVLLHNDFTYGDSGPSVFWIPRTDMIVFLAKENQIIQIFTVHANGTGLKRITQSLVGVDNFWPALVNGGIAWSEPFNPWDDPIPFCRWTKLDGTETTERCGYEPLSPNGKYMAWENDSDVFISKSYQYSSGVNDFIIVKLSVSDIIGITQDYWVFDQILWFPDSRRILISLYGLKYIEQMAKYYMISVSGEIVPVVLNTDSDRIDFEGSWSPDGKIYIYSIGVNTGAFYSDTMETKNLDIQIPDCVACYSVYTQRIFWLPKGE